MENEPQGQSNHFHLEVAAWRKTYQAGPFRGLGIGFAGRKRHSPGGGNIVRKSPGEDPQVDLGNSRKETDFGEGILDSQAGKLLSSPSWQALEEFRPD